MEQEEDKIITPIIAPPVKKTRKSQQILKGHYFDTADADSVTGGAFLEIGVDEAGRGPMFGRVYVSAVVLPRDSTQFDFSKMKDSKKFHSEKKIKEAAEYIKTHAISWSVKFAEHGVKIKTEKISTCSLMAMTLYPCCIRNRNRMIQNNRNNRNNLRIYTIQQLKRETTHTRPLQQRPFWQKCRGTNTSWNCANNIRNCKKNMI